MLEATQTRSAIQVAGNASNKQRHRLLLAIVLLLTALTIVLVKDRQFWFGSDQVAAVDNEPSAALPSTPAQTPSVISTPAPAVAKHSAHVVKRATLSPIKMDVVARKTSSEAIVPAAQRTPVSNAQVEERVDASYPLLDGKTSVQGSVLLQALIATDGAVEDMRVLSGPTILVQAAREAVKQWKFKPFYENGKAVETQARVTVNFTIKVSNNTARYQPTSITSDGAL